jgi:predicted hydrolase (HD superfamily)
MTRDEAYTLLTEMMSNKNLIRHGLAVECIMRNLCNYLREREQAKEGSELDSRLRGNDGQVDWKKEFDEEEWAIVGLLHDADYELIEKDPSKHTLVTAEKLEALGVSERIIQAIKAHHFGIKPTRDNILESGVYAVDEMSGLITACALVQPEKKLATVTVESVLKKFKQPSFAAGARRDQIFEGIEELEISLEDFTKIALTAMQNHHEELGL